MNYARFNDWQLGDMAEALEAAEHYKEFDGIDCSVYYAFDIVDELRADGGEEGFMIAEELIDVVHNVQYDRKRYDFLAKEIGLKNVFGDFILLRN